jgi:hypothetical protein
MKTKGELSSFVIFILIINMFFCVICNFNTKERFKFEFNGKNSQIAKFNVPILRPSKYHLKSLDIFSNSFNNNPQNQNIDSFKNNYMKYTNKEKNFRLYNQTHILDHNTTVEANSINLLKNNNNKLDEEFLKEINEFKNTINAETYYKNELKEKICNLIKSYNHKLNKNISGVVVPTNLLNTFTASNLNNNLIRLNDGSYAKLKIIKKYLPVYYPVPIERRINIPVRVPIKVPQRVIIPQYVPIGIKVPIPIPVKVEVPEVVKDNSFRKDYKTEDSFTHIPIFHHYNLIDNNFNHNNQTKGIQIQEFDPKSVFNSNGNNKYENYDLLLKKFMDKYYSSNNNNKSEKSEVNKLNLSSLDKKVEIKDEVNNKMLESNSKFFRKLELRDLKLKKNTLDNKKDKTNQLLNTTHDLNNTFKNFKNMIHKDEVLDNNINFSFENQTFRNISNSLKNKIEFNNKFKINLKQKLNNKLETSTSDLDNIISSNEDKYLTINKIFIKEKNQTLNNLQNLKASDYNLNKFLKTEIKQNKNLNKSSSIMNPPLVSSIFLSSKVNS